MLIGENILLALNGLRANKMRSLLTMLGIIIGIASVIAIMTLGDSISSSVTDSMASMGANNITVGVSQKSTSQETTSSGMTFSMGPRFTKMTEDDYISDEMLDSLEERYGDSIQGFSLTESVGSGTAQLGSLYAYVNATGVNEANLENTDLTLLAGRTLTSQDQDEAKKVILVSDLLVEKLFNGDNLSAVGQKLDVLFNNRYYSYTIVGVYEYEESTFSSSSSEDTVTTMYLPLQTALDQTHNRNGYSQLTILTKAGVSAIDFCTTIETYMNNRYYKDNDSFEISAMSMESIVESMTSMLSTVSLAIAAIAGISLLVGGIGVMNIMLVSITERTREIGLRMSIGAKGRHILFQFLIEAVIISVTGGIIGVILGIGSSLIIKYAIGWPIYIQMYSVVLSFLVCTITGIFFP